MKYKAPAGVDGINLGGQHFSVKDGILEVPATGNYDGTLRANGFTPIETTGAAAIGAGTGDVIEH